MLEEEMTSINRQKNRATSSALCPFFTYNGAQGKQTKTYGLVFPLHCLGWVGRHHKKGEKVKK